MKWKRRIYRLRARVYTRLPGNKSLLKGGLVLMFFLGCGIFVKLQKTIPEWFYKAETKKVIKEEKETNEAGTKYEIMENGYLSVEYVEGSARLLELERRSKKELIGSLKEISGEAASYDNKTEEAVKSATNGKQNTTEESALKGEISTSGEITTEIAENATIPNDSSTNIRTANSEAATVSGRVIRSITGFQPYAYPTIKDIIGKKYLLGNMKQLDYLKDNFYIVNATTKMTPQDFKAEQLLNMDLSMEIKNEPQILIYHTHSSEAFIDSRKGVEEDTVIGMGEKLKTYLEQKYGFSVLHDTTVFDMKNGKDNRSHAYNEALPYITKLLEKNPGIEVIIDLHRDDGAKRVVTLQGKQVAKVMLFNGISRNQSGELSYLANPNLTENLAFSLQTKLIGDEMYPGLMHRIFLKDYRYNMHLTGKYMLIELGTINNTVEEAQNAMEPLADILAQVLKTK